MFTDEGDPIGEDAMLDEMFRRREPIRQLDGAICMIKHMHITLSDMDVCLSDMIFDEELIAARLAALLLMTSSIEACISGVNEFVVRNVEKSIQQSAGGEQAN